jgi:hypothetical protein
MSSILDALSELVEDQHQRSCQVESRHCTIALNLPK